MHISDDDIPKAQNKLTFQSLINGDEIKSSYGEQIQNFLKIIWSDHVWQNKGTFFKKKPNKCCGKEIDRKVQFILQRGNYWKNYC